MTIRVPAFKAHIQPVTIAGQGVLLFSEDGSHALHGSLYERVAPLIDGRRSADDIVAALAKDVDAARVYYALARLEKNGHIAESTPDMPADTAAFWHGLGRDPAAARSALAAARVRVSAVGDADASHVRDAVAELGMSVVDDGDAELHIALTDDYLHPDLPAIDRAARASGRPWMPVRARGFEIWLGPLFVSGDAGQGDAGCLTCLRHKLERHRLIHRFAAARQGAAIRPPLAGLPASARAACDLAAVEAARIVVGITNGLKGRVLSLDTRTWASRTHDLIRNPACPDCGAPPRREAAPLRLERRKVTFAQDGGHRTVAPDATLKRYERLVSPITGVVSALFPTSGTEGVAHVYMAGHNGAVRLDRLEHLKRGLRNGSAGKGVSETQARASALCEALERYSGEADGSEIRISGSFADMNRQWGDAVIHPNAVMRYSDRQYAERETWNARKSKFNIVPEPLADDTVVDWTPVWSLSNERHVYLPTQLVYYGAGAKEGDGTVYCQGCSNGNASGNTIEEAVLQGFFELVERDATALWWYNRLRRPGVDLSAFDEPWLAELAAHYATLGREMWALDITSDLGIPTFAAFSAHTGGTGERILFGLGCHLDARIALQRAFAEMNQMLGIGGSDAGSSGVDLEDDETLAWLRTATRANQPYVVPDPRVPARRRADFPVRHSGDLLEDIQTCRRIVEERGMEMLALDQTRPDVGLPVVKVIVPGLRHFWARFAPGRLYDVPVAMCWLDEPPREEDLNPVPIFF